MEGKRLMFKGEVIWALLDEEEEASRKTTVVSGGLLAERKATTYDFEVSSLEGVGSKGLERW